MSNDIGAGTEALIGMPLDKAKDLYARSGWIVRCVKADGRSRMVQQDVMPTRINVETEKGVITKVLSVG